MENREKRCMGCMNPLPEGRQECGICGYPALGENPEGYLPVQTALSDRYVCGRVLSVTGDAALYIGWDTVAKQPVHIREYLPTTLCRRIEGGLLEPLPEKELSYESYRQSFLSHARALARCRDLAVMEPVYDIFDQNGTAYTVSEYSTGISLKDYVQKAGGRLSWTDARKLFLPLLTAVAACHAAGVYHYGISPDTLQVGGDGKLHLTAFAIPEARTVSSELKPQLYRGFAAPEQYDPLGHCSPETDVYALGATLFWALSGTVPPDGAHRDPEGQDLLLSEEVADALPEHVAAALVSALSPEAGHRMATVEELRDRLGTSAIVSELSAEAPVAPAPAKKKRGSRTPLIVVLIVLAILLIAGAVLYGVLYGGDNEEEPADTPTVPTMSLPVTVTPSSQEVDVPDLSGQNFYELTTVDGFTIELDSMIFSNADVGTIVSQKPEVGSTAAAGSTIRVIISIGAEEKTIPNVAGWNAKQAQLYLEALGFKVETIDIATSTYDKGLVDSTSPKIGSTLAYGETITLRVSSTATTTKPTTVQVEQISVPDVAGWPQYYAGLYLRAVGFNVTVVAQDAPNQESGTVIGTDLAVGTMVDKDSALTMYVAS